MNQLFWRNRLSEWFNDLFKNKVTCFICKLISCFEGIVWVNDSMIYSKTVTCFICKRISCFEGIVWVNDSIIYSKTQSFASFVNESAVLKNRLSEWFNELFKNTVTHFICKWICRFEESFEWMIQWIIQKHSHLLHL